MISYTTEINLKTKTVVVTFRGQPHTFSFDNQFPLVDALKVSAEFMHNEITQYLADLVAADEKPIIQKWGRS